MTRSGAAVLDAVPSTVAAIVAVVALGVLLAQGCRSSRPGRRIRCPASTAPATRPDAPSSAGPAAPRPSVLSPRSAAPCCSPARGRRPRSATRSRCRGAAVAAPPIPAGAELDIPGLAPVITPNAEFYRIDTALQIPRIDPSTWSLRITGEVENEIELTWAELIALPLEESVTTLMCVSNEVGGDLIGNAVWLGYPIRELLKRAQPKAGADMVLSRSIDGFTAGTPLPVLAGRPQRDPRDRHERRAAARGARLPGADGRARPVRLRLGDEVGGRARGDAVHRGRRAYWTDRGWGERGPIKIESRIDVAKRDGGELLVAGVAWHQHTGISRVEVQLDDGPWADAELADAISIDTWVQWSYRGDADAGDHTVRVRATGADGETQTEDVAGVLPDGATGYHTIDVSL